MSLNLQLPDWQIKKRGKPQAMRFHPMTAKQ